MSEIERRGNNRDRVLALFQARGVCTNVDLNAICFRFGARIEELRKQGYDIRTGVRSAGGVVAYEYRGLKARPSLLELMA